MLGTEEGTEYLLRLAAPKLAEHISHRSLLNIIYLITFVGTTLVAVYNPSIVSMIAVAFFSSASFTAARRILERTSRAESVIPTPPP